jgi:hypothetical protein
MILLLGPSDSPTVAAARELGEKLGLAMLPMLPTPFGSGDLRDSVAAFLPIETPNSPVDVAEALHAGWLELWYQPKIDTRTLALRGAEALVRMRHPHWGVVQPACFIPDDGDLVSKRYRNLSSVKQLLIGATSSPSTRASISRSIFRCHSCKILHRSAICVSSYRITRLSRGLSLRSTAPRSFVTYRWRAISPSKSGSTRSPSR